MQLEHIPTGHLPNQHTFAELTLEKKTETLRSIGFTSALYQMSVLRVLVEFTAGHNYFQSQEVQITDRQFIAENVLLIGGKV